MTISPTTFPAVLAHAAPMGSTEDTPLSHTCRFADDPPARRGVYEQHCVCCGRLHLFLIRTDGTEAGPPFPVDAPRDIARAAAEQYLDLLDPVRLRVVA